MYMNISNTLKYNNQYKKYQYNLFISLFIYIIQIISNFTNYLYLLNDITNSNVEHIKFNIVIIVVKYNRK